jgi:glycine cleavage system aminomethyltransferase T/glycine/D-amino acid oxidase-like deaminating enzyme
VNVPSAAGPSQGANHAPSGGSAALEPDGPPRGRTGEGEARATNNRPQAWAVPTHARVVVVGGGIAGASSAYHLTKLGIDDVVLLEQGRLTCGTTWHAAGLVGQMRATRNATRMSRYGIELYASLERETGLATGWKQCGSVNVAKTRERMQLMRRQMTRARSFGVEFAWLTPQEIAAKLPLLRTDDLEGGVWIPGDGKANPTDLTQSLAKGARARGARIVEGVKVTGVSAHNGHVCGVRWTSGDAQGEIGCEFVVNCAGQWAREFAGPAGVAVPLASAEHFYLVTEPIAGVASDMPVIRDPDGYIYFKEEVGGVVMGGFEPVAKPWNVERIPERFEFQLLPEDWDQFEVLMQTALHRMPSLETAPVKLLLNGPESFTLDGNFLLGEAPELRGYFVCAGFNSSGIANAGGAGQLVAQWLIGGEPPFDAWDVDIRRFAPLHVNRRHLADRTVETLGLHYAMRWPREELSSVRPLRRSPLYDRLRDKRAVFGTKNNWERANYFLPQGASEPPSTLDTPDWLPWVLDEQRACREDVVVFDQTSFSKFVLKGRDALAVLERVCANRIDIPVGRIAYTAMLNERGGFESDVTITRVAANEFFILTGSAQTTRDFSWIERHIGDDERASLVDVTSAWSILSLMGPRAEALLSSLSGDDVSKAALPFGTTQIVDVGYARARAARISYVGGPGYELCVPTDQCVTLYDALWSEGVRFGLRDAGYYTIDALRIEAGRRAWGAELSPDETPLEAGLAQAVAFDKPQFIGRDALLRQREHGMAKRLVQLALDDPGAFAWGGEPIVMDGMPVGEITSAGYSRKHARIIAFAYARSHGHDTPLTNAMISGARYAADIGGRLVGATLAMRDL